MIVERRCVVSNPGVTVDIAMIADLETSKNGQPRSEPARVRPGGYKRS